MLGGPAEAISGMREARLTFAGARVGLGPDACPTEVTVIDVGGGSTEIIRGRDGVIALAASLDIGAVRLTERWLRSDPPSASERLALVSEVDRELERVPAALLAPPLLLLAGSATNLAACALGLDVEHLGSVRGRRVGARALGDTAGRLAACSAAERAQLPGIERGREATIAGGALLLARLVERAGATEAFIGDGGVRFGLAAELLDPLHPAEDGAGAGARLHVRTS